jgi:DNA primase large subunit
LNERYSLLYFQISQNEKKNIEEYLQTSSSRIINIDNTHFYKVPFSHIISLVKKRKVFLMHGEAFVPEEEMVYLFVCYFKKALISGFEVSIKLICE